MSKKILKKFNFQNSHSVKLLGGVHVSLAEKILNAAVNSIEGGKELVPKNGCDSIYTQLIHDGNKMDRNLVSLATYCDQVRVAAVAFGIPRRGASSCTPPAAAARVLHMRLGWCLADCIVQESCRPAFLQ